MSYYENQIKIPLQLKNNWGMGEFFFINLSGTSNHFTTGNTKRFTKQSILVLVAHNT